MNDELKTLVDYRMQRAFESIEEAGILLEKNHTNTYVNRLYYACFYAVNALLLSNGLSSAKHSGVRSLFHQNFVKTGIIKTDFGMFYDRLFDNRQKGDYADMIRFNKEEVSKWVIETELFVDEIQKIIYNFLNQ